MNRVFTLLALLAPCAFAVSVGPTAAAQNLVQNGDFSLDTPGTAGPPIDWQFTDAEPTAGAYDDVWSKPGSGTYFWLNGDPRQVPTLSQTLTVIPGQSYTFSGDFRSRIVGGHGATFAVRLLNSYDNSVISFTTFDNSKYGKTQWDWNPFSVTAVLPTDKVILSLVGQYGADDDYAIDNLSARGTVASEVPEPGVWLMTSVMLGMGGFALRRK